MPSVKLVLFFMVLLLSLLTRSSTCKSYSISSLSSEIRLSSGACTLDIVETFEYEFTGSYSTIGRAFSSQIESVKNIAIVDLTSGYSTSVSYDNVFNFLIMNFSPATPEGGVTKLSFQLSYTVVGQHNLFEGIIGGSPSKYSVSYYYKDNARIANLTSTFIFDSNIEFSNPPTSSAGGQLITNGNQYSVRFTALNLTTLYTPVVFFNAKTDSFHLCPLSVGAIVGIVIGSVAGAIIIIAFVAFVLIKGKTSSGNGSFWAGNGNQGQLNSNTTTFHRIMKVVVVIVVEVVDLDLQIK